MGRIIAKRIRGMNWMAKISLILIFTMAFSIFMHQGLYMPKDTSAAVATSTEWAILGSSATTVSALPAMTLAKGTGTNRLLVVTFLGDYGAASTVFSPVITYGGQTLTRITSTDTSSRQKVWIGYLNEAGIAAATGAPPAFSVSYATGGPGSGCALSAAFYNGVNQTTPITGSRAVSSDTAATTPTSSPINTTAGGWAIYALNTNAATAGNVTVPAGYTERFDQANGTLYTFTMGSTTTETATGTTDPLPTWTSVRYAFLTASLEPSPGDITPPTVSSVAVQSGLVVNVTFSEPMGTGVATASNYTISGIGKGSLSVNPNTVALVSGNTYRLTWSAGEMVDGGNVTITVANAQDLAGNAVGSPNSATHTGGGVGIPPTVSSATVQTGLTVDVAFSEPMGTGVTTAANYTVSGTGKGSLTDNPGSVSLLAGNTYRLTWSSGEMVNGGNITITVANAQDLAGNAVGTPNSATHTGGGIAVGPTVTINQAAGQADPTAASPINFTVVFNKTVSNFTTGDVTITGTAGGTKTATVTGSGTTYNVAVTGMTTNGTVIASINAGVATDAGGNPNSASTSTDNTVTFNNAVPAISISEPNGIGDAIFVGAAYNITYTLTDPDDVVTAAFYYDNNNSGLDGTALTGACSAAAEGTGVTCSWDTAGMTPGSYYIYGITSDGRGNISAYSPGAVTINPTCVVNAPQVEFIDLPKFITTDNGNVGYSVKITNKDAGGSCANPLTINLGRSDSNAPKFSSSIQSSVSLAPGASALVTLTVTEATALEGETTTTTVTASAAGHANGTRNILTTFNLNNPLNHNFISTESRKWSSFGGWGEANTRYGEFVCDTCHMRMATNIKSIRSSITTPDSSKGTLPGDGQPILYDKTWGTLGSSGTMGDDSDTPRASSNKICEVCHTYDPTGVNGSMVHAYDTGAAAISNHMNADATDCTVCHKHREGFKSVSCETCHGMPPTEAGNLTSYQGKTTGSATAGRHATHAALYGGLDSCDHCHKDFMMPELSSAAPGLWDISLKFSNFGATTGTYSGQAGLSYNQSAGTGGLNCSTVYCHSGKNGTLDGGNKTPAWNGSVACGDCHKATAANPPTLGNHARHAGNGAGQLNLACSDCHGPNGAGGQGHVDGKIQWALNTSLAKIGFNAKYWGSISGTVNNLAPSSSYQTCSSIYCHSNVQGTNGAGAPTSFKTPTWGGGSPGCGGCHADNSGLSGTGSHVKHANIYNYACSVCHSNAGAGAEAHANYSIEVLFSGQAAGSAYSQPGAPGNGYGSCSTVYCHSNVQAPGGTAPATVYGTPEWGDASLLSCGFCHVDMATTNDLSLGTHQRHTNAPGVATYSCSMCHGSGNTATTANPAIHANGNIDTSFIGKASGTTYSQAGNNIPGIDGYGTCSTNACHGRSVKNWGGSSELPLCDKCHGSAASLAVDGDFRDTAGAVGSVYSGTHKSHLAAIHNYTAPMECDNCHAVPTVFGDPVTGVGHAGSLPATLTWSDLAKGGIKEWGTFSHAPSYGWGTTARTCSNTYCHSKGGAKPSPSWGDLGYGLSCGNCHGNPPALPHPGGEEGNNCKGCHYHVDSANTGFEATYRLLSGLCSKRTYNTDKITCETNGGVWTPAGTNVPGNALHLDGIVLVDKDECLGCHSSEGDFALGGQHYMHTDNDYFLSTSWSTGSATGGSTTTLENSGAGWATNAFETSPDNAGYYVRILSEGLDHGRQLRIQSNTPTTLTVKSGRWFSSAVTGGTPYEIRKGKTLSNDDYNDPSWIYGITYDSGFPKYACGACHPATYALHRNGEIDLDMNPNHSLPGTVKTKNSPAGPWYTVAAAATWQTVGGVKVVTGDVTCLTVYCHSNGYISPATNDYQFKATPNWYAAAPWASVDRCAQCHGNSPNTGGTLGSAAHAKHARGIHQEDTFTGTFGNMSATSAHGDGNSTIVNCGVCHYDAVKVAYNDHNTICATCHGSSAGLKGVMDIDQQNTVHVNGNIDVTFAEPLNLKTKAQLRDDITTVPSLNASWTRLGGYKQWSTSADITKTTPTYSAGTCLSTACHNAMPMQWGQAGPLQCMVCHIGLPK